ncbi:DUF3856 domain-containing protein [Chitinophagaceae bacterium LWZ2-11]
MPSSVLKYLFGLPILLPLLIFGQRKEQNRVDSFLALLPKVTAIEDTNKASVLLNLSFAYFAIDPDLGIHYGEQALALTEKLKWKKGTAKSLTALGADYWAKNDFIRALDYYRKGIKIYEEIGDKVGIAINLNNMAGSYQALYNYPKAIECYEKAIDANQKLGDKIRQQGCYQNIAELNEQQNNYKSALVNYSKALSLNEELKNRRNVAYVLGGMGGAYAQLGNYDQALESGKKALKTFEELGEKDDIALTLGNIGNVYLLRKNYERSIDYYKRAIAMTENLKGKFAKEYLVKYWGCVGRNYLSMVTDKTFIGSAGYSNKKELLQKAIESLQTSKRIAEPINNWAGLKEFLPDLSQAQALAGNNKAALETFKAYSVYKDSLYNSEKDKEITKNDLEYEYGRQQDSLRYVNNLQQSKLVALDKEKQLAGLRLKQQWLYMVVVMVIVCLAGVFFVFRSRIKNLQLRNELAKEKAQKELKEAEYKNRMNDITYTALRSQMNPHFIFNCLNSIKLYAEQNNTEAASEYLTKFSKLIRMILDHSRANTITLTSEIELLHLYLEMEAMRFKSKLQYTINVETDVEPDFIEIPPMLIQPYVENSIWHGLMHKEAGGIVNIHIAQSSDYSMLIITIADNGVGRVKAAELKSKSFNKHTSYGTLVTAERLALLNEKYQSGAEVQISDLEDEDNRPSGTLVTIKLPIK